MNVNYTEAFDALREMDDILLLTHRLPDGDAVGSIFALYLVLKGMGKRVKCITDKIPSSLKIAALEDCGGDFEEKYVVTVDVGDRKLLGDELNALYGDKVDLCIDHHGTNVEYAKRTLLDPAASAACEVIFDMLGAAGEEITKDIAKELYIGIATDTGCFRYGNTTAKTMRTAAALMETGIDTVFYNTEIFETKSREYAAFEKLALNNLHTYFDGKCAVMVITRDMYEQSGLDEAGDKAVNPLPRQIEGVLAGITLKEKKDGSGWRVSVRSKDPVSAAEICIQLDGGGHKLAAGCELTGTCEEAVNAMLGAAEKVLNRV